MIKTKLQSRSKELHMNGQVLLLDLGTTQWYRRMKRIEFSLEWNTNNIHDGRLVSLLVPSTLSSKY